MQKPSLILPNGAKAKAAADPGSEACVDLLERTLADAKAGKITTLCIVAVGPHGAGPAIVGKDIPHLNLGMDVAKALILQRLTENY